MKRTIINLTDKQDHLLRVFSKNNGYSVSEVIRRAIDEYLRSELKDGYYNFEDSPLKKVQSSKPRSEESSKSPKGEKEDNK